MVAKFKKNKKKRIGSTRAFSVIMGILFLMPLGFLAFSNWQISRKRAELKDQLELLQKKIEILDQRKKELTSQVSAPIEDNFWENKLREQGYSKPGEEMTVILPQEGESPEKPESKNLFEQILEKIKFW
jgi:cell division protein FtsB